jgi:type IV secretion system protein VirD4
VFRFGTSTDASVARRRDVQPLVVKSTIPPTGRLLLGRVARRGPLLATEDRARHPMSGRVRRRQGDRGSVALIGPTRSGKTVLAAAGIAAWDGPVVALSVKRDLYDVTAAARARRGEVAVFDPSAVTGLWSARWSPLRDVTTATTALRAGRALAQAIPRVGVHGPDFWGQHGEALCSAYMALAGLSQLLPGQEESQPRERLTIEMLSTWAHHQAGITHPVINELIRSGLGHEDELEIRLLARHAMTHLMSLHREDSRIRGSIFATARLAFEAWLEPAVAHSASEDPRWAYNSGPRDCWDHQPRWIDLDWLMGAKDDGRANTLYLCAPETEFARLAPVLGGLLGDLREQIHGWDIRGDRLEKPLLIVVDEAGQLGLQWLPAAVSTLAGLGAILVTGWQSRAQIVDTYGTLADAVMSGHRSKVFFAGLDDPASADYLTKVAGAESVARRGWSADVRGGSRSVSEHQQREELLPANVVRQMTPQEAVLLHGTLPPIHLKVVRWWEDRELKGLVPVDAGGRAVPPDDIPTCPLSELTAAQVGPLFDQATVREAQALLPKPKGAAAETPGALSAPPSGVAGDDPEPDQPADSQSAPRTRRPPLRSRPPAAQGTFPFDQPADEGENQHPPGSELSRSIERNRIKGGCDRCRTWLEIGEGETVHYGGRDLLRCYPSCRR